MRQSFFGASATIPDSWANRSTIVFVGPPIADQPLTTLSKQRPLASGSIALTPPFAVGERSLEQEVQGRLSTASRELADYQGEAGVTLEQLEGRELGWSVCRGRPASGVVIKQIVAILRQGGRQVGMTAVAPAAHFEKSRDLLFEVLRSVAIDG